MAPVSLLYSGQSGREPAAGKLEVLIVVPRFSLEPEPPGPLGKIWKGLKTPARVHDSGCGVVSAARPVRMRHDDTEVRLYSGAVLSQAATSARP